MSEQELITVVPLLEQLRLFEDLVQETHELLQKKEELEGEYVEVIIKIGQNLNEMRPHKPRGQFAIWIEAEFHISRVTAQEYMRIAIVYGRNVRRAERFSERILAVLSAPSTTEDVRQLVEAGQIPATREAIRAANKARKALKKVEQWEPKEQVIESVLEIAEETEPEEINTDQLPPIYHCPIVNLHEYVEADGLDIIITDPPYPREYLSVYTDLAKFAAYALKPGGSLIVMAGQSYLPEVLNMLQEHLTYHWVACYYVPGETTKLWRRNIGASWKPLLWFVKGKYTGAWVKDVIFEGRKKDKKHHEWGQPVDDMVSIIEHFTQPDQIICDPFVGGGSTGVAAVRSGRRFIGCDIKEECVKITKQRIADELVEQNNKASDTLTVI